PLIIALRMPWNSNGAEIARFALRSLIAFIPAFALAYLIMIFSWPWAAQDFFNPARALFAFAHFNYPIRTMLSGEAYEMGNVPRWYVPTYLAIKLPLTMLFGAALAVLFSIVRTDSRTNVDGIGRRREIAFIAFIALFP